MNRVHFYIFQENIIKSINYKQDNHLASLFSHSISAGFPSPADDYLEKRLDLNKHLVKNPAATFFVRVAGDSMIGAGIHDEDLLVVDRSLRATHGKIVIAIINNEFTVKRLIKKSGKVYLVPENSNYKSIELKEDIETIIWGVVTTVLHDVR